MASRTTEWRHRTGRSNQRRPQGEVNYGGVAMNIAKKYFSLLVEKHYEDVQAEIALLVF